MKGPGWDTRDCDARGHGFQDDRPGSYDRRITDVHAWQDDRSDADVGGLTDGYGASQQHAGRDMHVIADHAIVLDNGGRVHDAISSDPSARIDHGFRHHDCSSPNRGRFRKHCGGVNECGWLQTVFESPVKACGPHFVVSNGHRIRSATFSPEELQALTGSEKLAGAELLAKSIASVIDERYSAEPSRGSRYIEDHLPVPARAPQHQVTHLASIGLGPP